jgi:hypothetical protein
LIVSELSYPAFGSACDVDPPGIPSRMWYWDADDAKGVHPRLATLHVAKNLLCHLLALTLRKAKR